MAYKFIFPLNLDRSFFQGVGEACSRGMFIIDNVLVLG